MSQATVTVQPSIAVVTIEPARPAVEVPAQVALVTLDHSTPAEVSVDAASSASVTVEPASADPTIVVSVTPATITIDGGRVAISDDDHDARDTLVHAIAESCDVELAYDVGGNLARSTTWATAAHLVKVRETLFTYDVDGNLTETTTTQHDAAGVVVVTLTKTLTYTSGDLTGVESTLS